MQGLVEGKTVLEVVRDTSRPQPEPELYQEHADLVKALIGAAFLDGCSSQAMAAPQGASSSSSIQLGWDIAVGLVDRLMYNWLS